jgi:beta-glucosidase
MRRGLGTGAISRDRLDDAVRRILRVKMEMGLFEAPMPTADPSAVGAQANRDLAARAASESAVLLRTSDGALPLPTEGPVLLAGMAADDIGTQVGGWSITWQGEPGPVTPGTTLRAALVDRLGDGLSFEPDGAFAADTRAPVGIVVVAEPPYAEGRGDSATLELPADQLDVVDRVRPLVDRLIVVVYSGRPMILDRLAKADAVVAAWIPGTEAQGIAAVLLGDQSFTGTTPYAWPVTADDAPRSGKAACDGAVFPVGYGLASHGSLLGPGACPPG